MPSTGITPNNSFGSQSGPIPLDQLDSNFDELAAVANSLSTYSNYFLDLSGAADTITITVPPPLDPSLVTGVQFQVKMAHTNLTTSPTLTVNALGVKAIVNPGGSPPYAGQFVAGGIYTFIYNGTAFQVIGAPTSASTLVNLSAYKPSQQVRSSTTTLADDADLIFASMPAGTYKISGMLQFQGSVTGTQGFKFALAVGGSISGNRFINMNGIVNNGVFPNLIATSFASPFSFATIQTSQTDFMNFYAIVTTTTIGNIALQWAQASSSVNATILNDRSWMTAVQIA